MSNKQRWQLTVFASFIGLSCLLLYTTLVQDVLFKGVTFCQSDGFQLTFKVMGFGSAGLVTGFLTSLLVLQDNYYPNMVLSLAVVMKVFLFVGCPDLANPLWYDVMLSGSAVTGLWMGYYGGVKFPLSPA